MTTEGDAFQFVFHHATDAVAYAVAAQQALLTAKWPLELENHYRTRSRGLNDPCSSEDAELGNTACPGADLSLGFRIYAFLSHKPKTYWTPFSNRNLHVMK